MGFGPAFEGGKLRHVSASQLAAFEQCPSKWYNNVILKRPLFQDYRWSQMGAAIHAALEHKINVSIGKTCRSGKVIEASLLEEANAFVTKDFNWNNYFIGHEIIGAEIEISYPIQVGESSINLVGSIDVGSLQYIGNEIIPVSTDWKTGYSADKGVDIQAKCCGLMSMRNYSSNLSKFRRIYPSV